MERGHEHQGKFRFTSEKDLVTINEDTGEEVVCPICNAADYWACGHLVASLDRSFCECQGGALLDREAELSSRIEDAFLPHLENGSQPSFGYSSLEELWVAAKENFSASDGYVVLDGDIWQRVLIEHLEDAGAFDLPGPLMDPDGPGMTSSMSLLFAEKPKEVVDKALQDFVSVLNEG